MEHKIRSGKNGLARDMAEQHCGSNIPMRERLVKLANMAALYMQEQNKLPVDPSSRVDVMFTMRAEDFNKLKLLVKDMKKPDGKPMSQQFFLEKAVLNAMRPRR